LGIGEQERVPREFDHILYDGVAIKAGGDAQAPCPTNRDAEGHHELSQFSASF